MLTRRDIGLGLLVVAIWALNAVIIKFITHEVEPFTGLCLRLAIAAIAFAPFFRPLPRKQFLHLLQITVLICVLHWASLIWAINLLDASMAAILLQLQVVFSLLWGWLFFNERFGWRTGIGIALGVAGVAVLVGMPDHPPSIAGVIGIILSVLTLTLGYARMKGLEGVGGMNYIAQTHIFALPPMVLIAFAFETPLQADWSGIDYATLLPCLLFQVFIVGYAHMLWQRLMNRNAMSSLPNLTLLIPLLGVIFAVILLGEQITMVMVAGGFITTIGVAIILIRKQQKRQLVLVDPAD